MPPYAGTGQDFMEKTKYRYLTASDQEKHLPQPPLEVPPDPEKPVFDLPEPSTIDVPPLDLRTAIEERHSIRVYARESLTISELDSCSGAPRVSNTFAARMQPSARSLQPGPGMPSRPACSSMMSKGSSRDCTGTSPSPTVSRR